MRIFYIFLLSNLLNGLLQAQSSQELFGKNRIQYTTIRWKVLQSDRFEVYYYGDNYDLARIAATYGESDLNRISNALSYSSFDKIKIVLYNSVTDQLQSNIGLNNDELLIGGQTVLVKSKVEIAFRGTQYLFMEDISFGIAHILLDNMMYGGSLKDVVKSSYLMHLPDWFMLGAASHLASGWSLDMDNHLRDLSLHKKLRTPGSYQGSEARIVGHSVFNYIEREYSPNDLSVVIGYTKIFRDIEESIESALGISYPEFIKNWKSFYYKQANVAEAHFSAPSDSVKLKRSGKYAEFIQVALNPSGNRIAWVANKRGKYQVKVAEVGSKKTKTVLRGGYKRLDQPIDYFVPVVAWSQDNTLAIAHKKRLKTYLSTLLLKDKKRERTFLKDIRQVFYLSYSTDGMRAVLSADKLGQSDLFLLQGGALTQLTNDYFDDLNPIFSGTDIIFSSNRFSDTLQAYPGALPSYSESFHLFKLKPGTNVASRFSVEGNNLPLGWQQGKLWYLNDQTGVLQLYQYGLSKGPASVNLNNYKSASLSGAGTYAYITRKAGRDILCLENLPRSGTNTPWFTDRKNFVNAALGIGSKDVEKKETNFSSEEEINLDNVIFESDVKKDSSIIETILPPLPELQYWVPLLTSNGARYRNAMSGEKINSTLLVDPIRGLGMQMEAGMSDLVGNHRINAGAFLSFDFRSNKLFGEYNFLQHRIDFKLRYDRQGIFATNDYQVIQRYMLNSLYGTASYPLSPYHRISVSPGFVHTRFGELTDLISLTMKDRRVLYPTLKAEYVFDNSLITGMNMLRGAKAKFSFEVFQGDRPFQVYNLDIRKYIPVHKEIVLALRAAQGGFLGDFPKNMLLGGMDNWIFGNRNFYSNINNGPTNPLVIVQGVDNSDLLFLRYATNMRGFSYQAQFGNKYTLFNAELRVPVVQYFSNGTIGSAFLRNLQFNAFLDAGSAYNGSSPFSTDNSQSTETIQGNPFTAIVRNYRSPFLYGYGAGVRSLLFGYYVKFDLAVGVEDQIRQKPQAYLTFGYDF
ncbi:MAG: hypothetical protein MUF42_05975 [Cytophagaceae bacterium]|jgi:hypothetical protein|nr:hypothetical protein [Cytophagaceae bacterium]